MSENKQSLPSKIYQFARVFVISGFSASLCKTILIPIQLIQSRIFYQDIFIQKGLLDQRYKGVFDCFKKILIKEGPRALWKGTLMNVRIYFPIQSINFSLNDTFKRAFNQKYEDGFSNWFATNMISGGLAGFVSLVFLFQYDQINTKLYQDLQRHIQGHQRQYQGFIDAYKKTLLTEGVSSLYKGFAITSLGNIIYRSIYFGMYESSKPFIPQNLKDVFLVDLGIGFTVALLSNLASLPVDTVRKTMIMKNDPSLIYQNSFQCFQQIIAKKGALFLFQGLGGILQRVIQAGGTISGYDWIQRKLN